MTSSLTVSAALASSGLVPLESKMMLAHVLERDRAWLAAHRDDALSIDQARRFEALARRRHNGEPVAYLLGHREFYGLQFEVTSDVLIPRPETELLVEFALEKLALDAPARVLDLGTGSGAVGLAIASSRPRAAVIGADLSALAISLARRNAQRLAVINAVFVESDWFANVPRERFDVIVANPPYIAEHDHHLVEGDLRFEPRCALTPGGDGLSAIHTIVDGALPFLVPGGAIGVEHGHDQADTVQAWFRAAGFAHVSTRRDLAGIPRMTVAMVG